MNHNKEILSASEATIADRVDPEWYLSRYPDVAAAGEDPRAHYVHSGRIEGRHPNAEAEQRQAWAELVDPEWYLSRYPDVAAEGEDPRAHYVHSGRIEGRHPNAEAEQQQAWAELVDPEWYLSRYPDVAAAGEDPRAHYVRNGRKEGRHPNAEAEQQQAWAELVDPEWYLSRYPDVAAAGEDPRAHYVRNGRKEGRHPNAEAEQQQAWAELVDPEWYLSRYPDVAAAGEDPRAHYVRNGRKEGRHPNAEAEHQRGSASRRQDWITKFSFRPTERQINYARSLPIRELPTIAVVIPSYNQGKYISQTINSVLRQEYPNIEIYVADGGSTDETVDHLKFYRKKYPKIFDYESRPDGGHFPAVNKAIAKTSGSIIAWINSDDYYAPNAFWNVATFFLFNCSAFVVYGKNGYVRENGDPLTPYPVDWSPLLSEQREKMARFCIIGQPSLFFKRDAPMLCGNLRDKLLDYELWLRWQKDIPFYFMDRELSYSRLHSSSITNNANGELLDGIIRLVRRYYGLTPMSWCVRAAYNEKHGADWTEGKSSPIDRSIERRARYLWLKYNVIEQPLIFIRHALTSPNSIRSFFRGEDI